MHLNQIHSFLAVSKTLNFTGAARQIGVPQSTISRQINDLESQLGVRLFYRTKRDVQLTDEGRIFLPYAQEMADAARKGSYAVRQLHEGAAGRLTIAAVPASRRFLAEALARFHESYPDITVDIVPFSAGTSLMDETDAPCDFWFLYRDMLTDPENFDYLRTHRDPLCLLRRSHANPGASSSSASSSSASSSNEPAASSSAAPTVKKAAASSNEPAGKKAAASSTKNPAVSLPDIKDLSAEHFVLLSEESDPILYMQALNYCRTHRFAPKVSNTFEDISSVLLAVSAGLGVSILPQSLLQVAPGSVHPSPAASASGPAGDTSLEIFPLDADSYAVDCIAAWKPSLLNPAASLFLETLR